MFEWGHRALVFFNTLTILPRLHSSRSILVWWKKMKLDCISSGETKQNLFVFCLLGCQTCFKASDGCQGAYCPLHLPNSQIHTHTQRHTPSHEQVRQYANTRGTCSLDAFTLQSLTPLTASQNVGCSFSQLCLHICFSGCNRVIVGMTRVGVIKKNLHLLQ